ncbi:hypothetical protein VULLAG_LOCUS18225 [Vulpes lagopus]
MRRARGRVAAAAGSTPSQAAFPSGARLADGSCCLSVLPGVSSGLLRGLVGRGGMPPSSRGEGAGIWEAARARSPRRPRPRCRRPASRSPWLVSRGFTSKGVPGLGLASGPAWALGVPQRGPSLVPAGAGVPVGAARAGSGGGRCS